MTQAQVVLLILWTGLSAYVVFGGADFGAGFWDLFSGSAEKGKHRREVIAEVIGPVWEVNHVWLIFVLVVLWTGFPEAFGSVFSTLYIPLTLAAFGVILRGSGFAFRKVATTLETQRVWGALFAGSSVITPFFLGTVAGGIASGRVPVGDAEGNAWTSWLNPLGILGGLLAVVVCAFLAATFLTRESQNRGAKDLVEGFRRDGLASGVVAGGGR